MKLKLNQKALSIILATSFIIFPAGCSGEKVVTEQHVNASEDEVVNHFSELENQFESEIIKDDLKEMKNSIDKILVEMIGFIFYDEEYKGVTFNELTDSSKEKITSSWMRIEQIISTYYPDYKIDLKNGTDNACELWNNGKETIDQKLSEKIGVENWTNIKEDVINDFNDVADLTQEGYDKASVYIKEKMDNWYKRKK